MFTQQQKITIIKILTEKHQMFGLYYEVSYFSAVNYIDSHANMYIYRQAPE